MRILRSNWLRLCLLSAGVILSGSLVGCEPGNPNQAEYDKHTPPGKPPDNPNESVSQRRSRTLKVGGKVQPAPAKGADAKQKSP